MIRSKSFQTIEGKTHFCCPTCNGSQYLVVPANVRYLTVTCQRCLTQTRCFFNRRQNFRNMQAGRVIMDLDNGNSLETDLFDISPNGVGLVLAPRDMVALGHNRTIRLSSPWNPELLPQGRYEIKSIKGYRIGAQFVE